MPSRADQTMPACTAWPDWCACYAAGPEDLTGELSVTPASIIVKSEAQIKLTVKLNASLSAAAGAVKLYTCSAAGDPLQYLSDMQPTATGGSTYSASLALQGPHLGSLSSRPGVLRFTAVVGAENSRTGAVTRLELLPGACAISVKDVTTACVSAAEALLATAVSSRHRPEQHCSQTPDGCDASGTHRLLHVG